MIGSVALCVPVTTPSQLSVAVGAVNEATEHSAVTSDKVAISGTGAVMSFTVIVVAAETALRHPLASVI